MKKYLLLLPLVIGFSNAWGEISIENHQQYFGSDGSLYIVGEIQNQLDVTLTKVNVYATLYSENKIIDTVSTSSLVNTIMPGMKGPFEIIIFGQTAKMIDDYSLDIDYKVGEPKSQVIDVTSSEISRDNFDNLVITGMVTNRGDLTANAISIVATLYDKEGKVAAVSKSFARPDYLRSNDESFFLISAIDKTRTESIVDYSLVAESEEYAAVPEFPIGSMLLLVGSVSGYLLITQYARRSIGNLICALNPP